MYPNLVLLFPIVATLLARCIDCPKELHPLQMQRTPYTGDELRIDGYYYSTNISASDVGVAVFFRNGVCLHAFIRIHAADTFDFIERRFLGNAQLMARLWSTPTHIGLFRVNGSSIAFETWEEAYDITTFSHIGEILNDSTFALKERLEFNYEVQH